MVNFFNKLAETNIPHSETKLNQKDRNKLKAEFMDKLAELISQAVSETENVVPMRTADGIALFVDNRQVGDNGITITLNATFKDLTYEPFNEADCYEEKIEQARIKAEQMAKSKQKRIAESKAKKERG